MKLPTERKATVGFGSALLLLVIVSTFLYASTTQLVETSGEETHTLEFKVQSSRFKAQSATKGAMDDHGVLLAGITSGENDLPAQQNEETSAGGQQTFYTIYIVSILAVVLAGLAALVVNRNVTERKRIEEELNSLNRELERRVEERTEQLRAANRKLELEIAEHEQAVVALSESEERYRTLVEVSPDSITFTDVNGTILIANYRAAELFGYGSVEEIIGQNAYDLITPEDRERAMDDAQRLVKSNVGPLVGSLVAPLRVLNLEYTMLRKDSEAGTISSFPAEVNSAVIEDRSGSRRGFISVMRDISERKEAQEVILRQVERLSALRSIDVAITSSIDLRVTLDIVLHQVTAKLSVDAAAVLLLNPQTQILDFASGRGFRSEAIRRSRVRLGQGEAGQAAFERRTIVIAALSEARDYLRAEMLRGEDFHSYYALPLIARGEVKGVLEIFHRAPLEPEREWLNFLEALADQAALAIDNAKLVDDLQRSNDELRLAYDTTLEGWSRALDLRDKVTEGHTQRVTEIAVRLGRTVGMSEGELVNVRRGSLLHDMGKMGIPDSVLLKGGPLSDDEWEIMRRHPVYAYEMLAPIAFLRPALDIPYCHHENWDGSGYPRGLKGEEIPLAARIFTVIDVWDALRSDRPYRGAWPEEKVREHIRSEAGAHFDPQVVQAFLEMWL